MALTTETEAKKKVLVCLDKTEHLKFKKNNKNISLSNILNDALIAYNELMAVSDIDTNN